MKKILCVVDVQKEYNTQADHSTFKELRHPSKMP